MTETPPAGAAGNAASASSVAWVNGTAVSSQQATQAAAALLAGSRSAVVAGMGTDVAGVRTAIALAQVIGACVDHMDADAVFANLDVMRRSGWIVTTPLQVRSRADTVLLVGGGLLEAWPEMPVRLALESAPTLSGGSRRVFHLCPGATPSVTKGAADHDGEATVGVASNSIVAGALPILSSLPILPTVAAVRALAAGRRTSLDSATEAPLRGLAAALTGARFGAVIWSAVALEPLAVEMLCGLIDDLNRKTRFAGLPLGAPNGADCVSQAAAWITGFPVRTAFAEAKPLHDPWRFDAQRLVASGEADAAMWISALSPTPPPWDNAVPTIALVPGGTVFRSPPAVVFEVGCPGRDHDAMLFDQSVGGIAFATALTSQAAPSVAATVAAITAALPAC
jgi:formylmethanofuran dehydrogenase subunit B